VRVFSQIVVAVVLHPMISLPGSPRRIDVNCGVLEVREAVEELMADLLCYIVTFLDG
jgi:hypothetical protein